MGNKVYVVNFYSTREGTNIEIHHSGKMCHVLRVFSHDLANAMEDVLNFLRGRGERPMGHVHVRRTHYTEIFWVTTEPIVAAEAAGYAYRVYEVHERGALHDAPPCLSLIGEDGTDGGSVPFGSRTSLTGSGALAKILNMLASRGEDVVGETSRGTWDDGSLYCRITTRKAAVPATPRRE